MRHGNGRCCWSWTLSTGQRLSGPSRGCDLIGRHLSCQFGLRSLEGSSKIEGGGGGPTSDPHRPPLQLGRLPAHLEAGDLSQKEKRPIKLCDINQKHRPLQLSNCKSRRTDGKMLPFFFLFFFLHFDCVLIINFRRLGRVQSARVVNQ